MSETTMPAMKNELVSWESLSVAKNGNQPRWVVIQRDNGTIWA